MSGSSATGAAWGLFAISIWAGWMVLTRHDLLRSGLTVPDITAIRFGTAAALLLPVALRDGFVARKVGIAGTALMVAGAGAPYALIASVGLLFAPAAHAGALIPGVMPLFAAVLSMLVLGERIGRERRVGLSLIPFGVLLIAGLHVFAPTDRRWVGDLLFLSASLFWAGYTVTLRRSGLRPLHGAAIVAVWSAAAFLPVYVFTPVPKGIWRAGWDAILVQAVFQGLLTSVVSLIAFNRAVAILGASRGAVFASLVPALATLLAIPVLGEWPSAAELAGVGVVSMGVLLASGAAHAYRTRAMSPS